MTTPLYRLLADGEIIRTGDEFFNTIKLRWVPCTSATFGTKARGQEIRRPIPAEAVSVIRSMESLERTGQILDGQTVSGCVVENRRHERGNFGHNPEALPSGLCSNTPAGSPSSDGPTAQSLSAQSIAHASANEARADEVKVCQRCGGPCKCGMMDEVNVFPKGRWT